MRHVPRASGWPPPWAGAHDGTMVATETLTTGTVTIRERDSMAQERVAISELPRIVGEKVDLRGLLRKL